MEDDPFLCVSPSRDACLRVPYSTSEGTKHDLSIDFISFRGLGKAIETQK